MARSAFRAGALVSVDIDEAWARPGRRARIVMAALAVVVALVIFAVVSVVWKTGAATRAAMQAGTPAAKPSTVEVSLVPAAAASGPRVPN